MRAYRLFGLLIATATALLLAPASAAHAEQYPAEPPASSVSDGVVGVGGAVVFRGKGFLSGEGISVSVSYDGWDSTAALTGSTGSTGSFVPASVPMQRRDFVIAGSATGTFSVEVSLNQLGTATLTALGLASGVSVQEVVVVVASAIDDNSAGGSLPTTGSDGSVLAYTLYGGLGAILIGAGVIWLARTRRRPTPT